jgi:hypothetical protein
VGAEDEPITVATREIRDPAIGPREHDAASDRIRVWAFEEGKNL